MSDYAKKKLKPSRMVMGPTAQLLTLKDLPSPNTRRWVIRRKAEVIAAVRGGLLTKAEAMSRYNITGAEFAAWETLYDKHGLPGLRVTKVQEYR